MRASMMEIDPVTGDEMESGFTGFYEMKPETLAKLKEILVSER